MLEFYPMPTNLNGGLYSHQHNHGGARFLDSPNQATTSTTPTTTSTAAAAAAAATTTGLNNNICQQHSMSNNFMQHQQMTSSTPPTAISTTTAAAALTSPYNNLPATLIATATAAAPSTPALQHSAAIPKTASGATGGGGAATAITTTSSSSLSSSSSSSSSCSTTATKLSADCSGRTEVGHIKCEKNYEICEGCGQKIHDRYLMKVGESNWHEQCLACCYCGGQLHHICYVRNTKLYCKIDYDRIFAIKCTACCHPILPHELVMRPNPNYIFHLPCFICYACRLPLQKGEQFLLRDGQLLCFRHDLEKEMYLAAAAAAAHHCGLAGLVDDDDLMRPRDGRRGPKRPRTILTSQQRKQFKASFDQSPKPCRKVREALAKDTGLSVRVVQVWFQNQRAKMKKIQRKAKNGGGGGGANSGNADDKDKDKDEKGIKQESDLGSESGGYLGLDSAFASQPLNPNLPFSPDDYPAHSNDSFCSSDLSLDGSNFDQLDDDGDSLSLNNLDLQSTCSSGNQHSHGSSAHDILANLSSSLVNPINKLYQMQNSYFSSEQ